MVRVNDSTRKQRLIRKNLSFNQSLLNRQFIHVGILALIGAFGCLYFVVLSSEVSALDLQAAFATHGWLTNLADRSVAIR